MSGLDLIATIAGGLGGAVVLGYVTQRLGLSPILGYLLAGLVVGPHTPGYVADQGIADQLAEIGVILLMFGVGLQFHVRELLAVRGVAIPGALGQSLLATALGCVLLLAWGAGWRGGLVFGLAVSVASTVVLVRVLSDNRALHTPTGHIAVGWLVVEDLFTVLALVLLPLLIGRNDAGAGAMLAALGWALLKMALLVAFIVVVGGRLLPRILEHVARTGSRELFTLAVLALALGVALGASRLFGVSMALGAFLAGLVVGRSEFSQRAATEALPMRDAFAVLFFVSVGMLFSPADLLAAPGLALLTLAIVLVGKPLAALIIVLVLGRPPRVALAVAVALAQVGEFSFILAAMGRDLGVLDRAAVNALIAAAIVSIALNPLLFRCLDPLGRWLGNHPGLARWLRWRAGEEGTPPVAPAQGYRVLVVGYGPVGRTLTRLLRQRGIAPVVVELNLDTVRRLRAEGVAAVYGDASLPATLGEAGLADATALLLTSSSMTGTAECIRAARAANPGIRVLARADYVREIPDLRRAGADEVCSGEGEVALAMSDALLRRLGATPEQIGAERDRVRGEVLAGPAVAATPPPPG